MQELKCLKCGAVNQFYTELKANNNVARCSMCDAFIKNIPQGAEPTLFFGKYKGKKVSDIEDMPYLKWVISTTNPAETLRKAIQAQISIFENLAR